jgi:acetyl-CoA carboxylase carboxyl transferase subunit beta
VNWINNVVRPKIRDFWRKREIPDNLWVKCPETGQMVFYKDVEANQLVIPGSNYHMRMSADARLKSFFDEGKFERIAGPEVPHDPLKFRDERRYADRLKDARTKTGLDDAVVAGEGALDGQDVVAAAQDFAFMGGSLGMAAGEAIVTAMMKAVERNAPFILFAASGGARMQEGMLSLMQMPRTTVAVQKLREARLPYIVVLTHPTTGGVTASYAMLGDVHIAEPGALICFAGPRVIEQTIREKLPEGFQRAEYLLEHGMVDIVVHRHQLRETISRLCSLMMERRELKQRPDRAPSGARSEDGGDSAGGEPSRTAPAPSPNSTQVVRSSQSRMREKVSAPITSARRCWPLLTRLSATDSA